VVSKQPILLTDEIVPPPALIRAGLDALPSIVRAQGERARRRFIEFFTAKIRNRNTRMAYARAVKRFFDWCDRRRLKLEEIEPLSVAAYIEQLGAESSKPTVKQHLAAIRKLFDYLTTGGILESNPASSVRGPKYVGQARQDSGALGRGVRHVNYFCALTRDKCYPRGAGCLTRSATHQQSWLVGGQGNGEATEQGDTQGNKAGDRGALSGGGQMGAPPDPRRVHAGDGLSPQARSARA
jgi:Phage integrase, N-terminal SAM-like domain